MTEITFKDYYKVLSSVGRKGAVYVHEVLNSRGSYSATDMNGIFCRLATCGALNVSRDARGDYFTRSGMDAESVARALGPFPHNFEEVVA